jgi:putative membrane protein
MMNCCVKPGNDKYTNPPMYLWLKALHIIAVISWMAGMLYLPRLFVYHVDAPAGSVQSETFKVMERRLLNYIMTPAMTVTWLVGIVLVLQTRAFVLGWFQVKIVLVLAMTVLHAQMTQWVRAFAFDRNRHTGKFYRIVNEIPTILMILIVLLVTVKPF